MQDQLPQILLSDGLPAHKQKRRRYRIPRSCDRCRASKIRCVFQEDRCSACATARVPCTFANPGSLKERPPTRKDVEHLQARIRSLERLIHAIDPAFDLSSLPEPDELQYPEPRPVNLEYRFPTSSFTYPQSEKSSDLWLRQDRALEFDPDLSSLFFPSQLKLDATAGSFQFGMANVDDPSPSDKIIFQENAKRMQWNYNLYPEPDLEQILMEIYFKNIHTCLPLIHPATFMKDLQAGLSRTSDSFRILCLSMMAVSSRFSKDPRVFLDVDGHPQTSLQAAGIRYAMIVGSYHSQAISLPADIYDLQSLLIMVIYTLGTVSVDVGWDLVGFGLQRAQAAGVHLEKSPNWSTCPIQDHLRRKVFGLLYEFDCILSVSIGKPAFMQESDFDVLPHDLDFEVAIGTFKNPFNQSESNSGGDEEELKVTNDLSLASGTLKTSFGGLRNLFPLVDLIKTRGSSRSGLRMEHLVDRLEASMTKCYERIAQMFSTHESSNANVTDCQLTISVNAVTWYHELRLLAHKLLFNYKGSKNNPRDETVKTSNNNDNKEEATSKTKTINRHAEICVESARMILILIHRLHQRNALELGFYWIPLRLSNALIVLIISLKTFRKILSTDQRNLRHYEISLGIEILNALAPSTFLAGKCSRMISQFQQFVLHQDHNKQPTSSPATSIPNEY